MLLIDHVLSVQVYFLETYPKPEIFKLFAIAKPHLLVLRSFAEL